jgi:metacaspase-1
VRTGRALCIGVDTSESHDALAEADARALAEVASRQGFEQPTLLLGCTATRANVRVQLGEAADACRPGDLFMLTFSGHGGEGGLWVLYDGSLRDAEMRAALAAFRPGVRVLVISDSCNGGVPAAGPGTPLSEVAASVLVLAACRSDQFADAPGMPTHFTTALLETWHRESIVTYRGFYEMIAAGMPEYQQPNYFQVGSRDLHFEAQPPFTI